MRHWAALVLITLLSATPAWADGFPQNPHIAAAQQALDAGQLDKAWSELQQALLQPDNSNETLVEIYRLQGTVALYKGDRAGARGALLRLFEAQPDYVLPKGTSPKIRALFSEVQEDIRAHRVKPVTLHFAPIGTLAAGGPAKIVAHVEDLPALAHVRFFYRRVGTAAYSALDLRPRGEQASGILPADDLPLADAPFAIEYYVEVDDAAGRRLAGQGDALSPLTARVRAPDLPQAAAPPSPQVTETHWYQHWYVWTAIGVAVAAGGATTYYLLSRPSTGTLPLQVTFQ